MTSKNAILTVLGNAGPQGLRFVDIVGGVLELVKSGQYKTKSLDVSRSLRQTLRKLIKEGFVAMQDNDVQTQRRYSLIPRGALA
jgi:hypothetical protein